MLIDIEAHLETIWEALHCHRENNIPGCEHDREWDDICLAMANIRELLLDDDICT